jgi:hypothetical protein
VHAEEQLLVVRVGEVDLTFTSFDVLEPDPVLEVDATDSGRGDLCFSELAIEQVRPLGQGQVGGL